MNVAPIECPRCGKKITVDASASDERLQCPYCNYLITTLSSLQEPMLQEPMLQEPMLQEPMLQEPMLQEPMLQEPMLQASTAIDAPEPDLREPLLENFSVEPPTSDIKNEPTAEINQFVGVHPPVIESKIPIATPVEIQNKESGPLQETRFEKFLICIAFLIALAAIWAFFL